MIINKNSLSVSANGITLNLCDYIVQATFSYSKLWADDSGRNLAGTMTGTLIGIFPKITCQFKNNLTQTQLNNIAKVLDSATQTLTYFDINKNQSVSISTYTGDYSVVNTHLNRNKGFEISFIARSKRV